MEGDVVTLQDLFVARAPEHGWRRLAAARAAPLDRAAAGLPRPSSAPTASSCRRRPGWRPHETGSSSSLSPSAALAAPGGRSSGRSGAVQIRRVDLDQFPLVRVTAVVPAGSRPTLAEDGRPAEFVRARELGSAQAMVLAVDNSASMAGRPLREAKRAAAAFLSRQRAAGDGRSRRVRPRGARADSPRAPQSDVRARRSRRSLRTRRRARRSTTPSSCRSRVCERMSNGTPGPRPAHGRPRPRLAKLARRRRSPPRSSANVVVYAIAAGASTDVKPLTALASATGGRRLRRRRR